MILVHSCRRLQQHVSFQQTIIVAKTNINGLNGPFGFSMTSVGMGYFSPYGFRHERHPDANRESCSGCMVEYVSTFDTGTVVLRSMMKKMQEARPVG